ncbi:winged helix-turn-helix domain-containing protein [Flocculibacter collagenilyticus]|uniref:winged helix-turn-helix domain-containing protein n=1 Tax=Flocculibacter collagenilyticus TaxID=2744479 RepID=UPI0018F57CCB|nr:winged helix-turn-helix domain-containing protein [Flocculibacter collagenilyticus]
MHATIGKWIVLVEELKLTLGDEAFDVEPKVMDLLVYLMEHQGKVLSRDTLVNEVWKGVIVSDHAITSCIAKLRKIFKHDTEFSNYIETISKRGYRLNESLNVAFVEHPTQLKPTDIDIVQDTSASVSSALINRDAIQAVITETSAAQQEQVGKPESASHLNDEMDTRQHTARIANNARAESRLFQLKNWLGILILIPTMFTSYFSFKDYLFTTNHTAIKSNYIGLEPVTSLIGAEKEPAMSRDGRFLSYLHFQKESGKWNLNITYTDSVQILHVFEDVGEYTRPAWSPNGDSIIFHRSNSDGCNIYTAGSFNTPMQVIEEKKVLSCSPHSKDISFAWDKNRELVYFNESASRTEPRAIYQLNLNTGKKVQLTNPQINGFGDYHLRFSAGLNALFFLRNKYWHKETEFLSLDVQNNHIDQLLTEDKLVKSFTIDSKGNPIFSENKYEFAYYDLINQEKHIVYRAGFPVYHPILTADDEKMLFVTEAFQGKDIESISIADAAIVPTPNILNTSRDDFSPAFANRTNLVAFISNRTGSKQVYIADLQGNLIASTKLDKKISPKVLVWSPDDAKLFFVDDNYLFHINAHNGAHYKVELPYDKMMLTAVSGDGKSFYFASDHYQDWQIYRLTNNELIQVTKSGGYEGMEGHFGRYLYFTKFRNHGLWRLDLNNGVEEEIIADINILIPGSFKVGKDAIYYKLRSEVGFKVFKHAFNSQTSEEIIEIVGDSERGITVSQDEKFILYQKYSNDKESDIVMANKVKL